MTSNTRIYDKFEYHLEDTDCLDCLHYVQVGESAKRSCGSSECRYSDIRADAIANGRLKRDRGWKKDWLT